MSRWFFAAVSVVALLIGSLVSGDEKPKKVEGKQPIVATITKVDAANGDISVKYTDPKGQEVEKIFRLTKDVRLFDETGRVVAANAFESGHEVLILENEGRLRELRRAARAHRGHRLSDAVRLLIEMTDCEEGCVQEVQQIYDVLRKLDTGKDGQIDPKALQAERDRIVEERVDNLIKRLDLNQDGMISKEEAKGLVKEHFEKLDVNKDGFVDRNELLKAAKEKRDTKAAIKEGK